jgi:protein-tyrosine phosphatase
MIPLRDVASEEVAGSFDEVWEFISKGRQSAGRVLIHCKMGRMRMCC